MERSDTLSDTVIEDPWEKVLDAVHTMSSDLKVIKHQLSVLNTNVELVRHAQLESSRRLTLLETQCPKRTGQCPASLTPLPDSEVFEDCCDL